MKNYVELIGLCISNYSSHFEMQMMNGDVIKIYLEESYDRNILDLNVMTRVIGHISYIKDLPFSVIVADKVYQIKETIN